MKSSGEEEEVGKRNKYERKMKEKRKGKRGEGRGGGEREGIITTLCLQKVIYRAMLLLLRTWN